MADATDSKSVSNYRVWVRVPHPAPLYTLSVIDSVYLLFNVISTISGLQFTLGNTFDPPNPLLNIIVDFPILYSPKSYLGKNSLFGESNPPLIGSLIIPPCT